MRVAIVALIERKTVAPLALLEMVEHLHQQAHLQMKTMVDQCFWNHLHWGLQNYPLGHCLHPQGSAPVLEYFLFAQQAIVLRCHLDAVPL
jgi:hypothetical protein